MSEAAQPKRRGRGLLTGFASGLVAFARTPALLKKHRLWGYLWLPAILSLVLSLAILFGLVLGFRDLHAWLDGLIEFESGWLDALVSWSISLVAVVGVAVGFVFFHKHLVLVLLAPFLGRLAEVTVRGMEGEAFRQRLGFMPAIVRSAQVNSRSVALELGIGVLLFLAGVVIPVVGSVVSSASILLVQNYFLGAGLFDFPLEYRGRSLKQSVAFCREHRGYAAGIGLGYFLLMLIPIVGWMLAPTLGTVAGTALAMDLLGEDEESAAIDKA